MKKVLTAAPRFLLIGPMTTTDSAQTLRHCKRILRHNVRVHSQIVETPAHGSRAEITADYRFFSALVGPGPATRALVETTSPELLKANALRAPVNFNTPTHRGAYGL